MEEPSWTKNKGEANVIYYEVLSHSCHVMFRGGMGKENLMCLHGDLLGCGHEPIILVWHDKCLNFHVPMHVLVFV